jgi:hypothetical protein
MRSIGRPGVSMKAASPTLRTDPVLIRICGEFAEMPGLQLTRQQAQRLWDLDEETCARALQRLVDSEFLREVAGGRYGLVSEGRAVYLRSNDRNVVEVGTRPTPGRRTAAAPA